MNQVEVRGMWCLAKERGIVVSCQTTIDAEVMKYYKGKELERYIDDLICKELAHVIREKRLGDETIDGFGNKTISYELCVMNMSVFGKFVAMIEKWVSFCR